MSNYLGLDIGGSHISIGLVKNVSQQRKLEYMASKPIDSNSSLDNILDFISECILSFAEEHKTGSIKGIGIAMPGPFDYSKGLSKIENLNKYDGLFGVDLRHSLASRLSKALAVSGSDIHFINDAQGFLLGAVRKQNWKEDQILGLTIGTGFGSAFYKGNRIALNGSQDQKEYLYNAPYREGIAEDYFSTRWFVNRYNQLKTDGDKEIDNVKQLADQFSDDDTAKCVFQEFGQNLAEFLNTTLQLEDYGRIVIGGNIAKACTLFSESFSQGISPANKIDYVDDTSSCAVIGAVEHVIKQQKEKKKSYRKTSQQFLPVVRKEAPADKEYNIYPTFQLDEGLITAGYDELATWITQHEKVVIDGYGGVLWDNFVHRLNESLKEQGHKVNWHCVDAAWKEEDEIEQMVAPYLGGDDPIFGHKFTGDLKDFFEVKKLKKIQLDSSGINILYGCGAALSNIDAPVIYVEVPKNEIQYRSRSGSICNMGSSRFSNPKDQYKRFYFVDWPALNRHKKRILNDISVIVDEQRIDEITWMAGRDFRKGLDLMTRNMLRARPWFSPGVWGGDWIKNNIKGLSKDVPNYAWSFELIVPENGIIMESSRTLLEVSFDFLQYRNNQAVLGKSSDLFGDEFPIRFNFLDTINGGNLSLQCHPSETYIHEHFGENFTQNETYYILDCNEGAKVYLGFQDGVDKDQFREDLETSYEQNVSVEVEKYVQTFPSSKHDFFLIPNQTIHSSGKGNLVLEISNTSYLYTFKMYDWLRLDLDGKPRPINIERAFENLDFSRQGKEVEEELISKTVLLEEGNDWKVEQLTTHPNHFYNIHRMEFNTSIQISTDQQCHVLSLVEGDSVIVETNGRKQRVHYAETFVIPSAAELYKIINQSDKPAKIIKAFVKDEEDILVKPYKP